jgi:hypothetical protein
MKTVLYILLLGDSRFCPVQFSDYCFYYKKMSGFLDTFYFEHGSGYCVFMAL